MKRATILVLLATAVTTLCGNTTAQSIFKEVGGKYYILGVELKLRSVRDPVRALALNLRTAIQKKVDGLENKIEKLRKKVTALEATGDDLLQKLNARKEENIALEKEVERLKALPQTVRGAVRGEVRRQVGSNAEYIRRLASLRQCLKAEGFSGYPDFEAALKFSRDPIGTVKPIAQRHAKRLRKEMPQLLRQEFEQLVQALVEEKRLPSDDEIVTSAMRMLDAAVGPRGPARCVFNEVRPELEKLAQQIVEFALETVEDLKEDAIETLEKELVPLLAEVASDQLTELFDKQAEIASGTLPESSILLDQDELKAVTRQVLFERHIQERFATAEVVLAKLVNPRTAPRAARRHLADLQKLTQGTEDYEALYIAISLKVLRQIGHNWVDSKQDFWHGGFLLEQVEALTKVNQDTVGNIVKGVCGLIPEVGAAVSAVVWEVVDVMWNHGAVPMIARTASGKMHKAVDELADQAERIMLDEQFIADLRAGPSSQNEWLDSKLGDASGRLVSVLQRIPHEQLLGLWAEALLTEEMEMLDQHFQQVHDALAQSQSQTKRSRTP